MSLAHTGLCTFEATSGIATMRAGRSGDAFWRRKWCERVRSTGIRFASLAGAPCFLLTVRFYFLIQVSLDSRAQSLCIELLCAVTLSEFTGALMSRCTLCVFVGVAAIAVLFIICRCVDSSYSQNEWKWIAFRNPSQTLRQIDTEHSPACNTSDAKLDLQRQIWCESVMGPGVPWCYVPPNGTGLNVHKDWPNQVTYFKDILDTLVNPATCLNTSFANNTAVWLNNFQSNLTLGGTLLQTWASPQGQPNYYEMPRPPGVRIETPWTLGMKCWAFNYLDQTWNPDPLVQRLSHHGLLIPVFVSAYEAAIPLTFTLCREVMANCFVNASYDPSRNGTCPLKIDDFRGGWDWQNLQHGSPLHYPF